MILGGQSLILGGDTWSIKWECVIIGQFHHEMLLSICCTNVIHKAGAKPNALCLFIFIAKYVGVLCFEYVRF